MRRFRFATVATGAACAAVLGFGAATAAASSYKYIGYDALDAQSADGVAHEYGRLKWFSGGGNLIEPPVIRGEFGSTAKVHAVKSVGCIWVKVVWNYLTGSVTVSNSGAGGTLQNATYDNGYWVSCRRKGQRRPKAIGLYGVDYAKRTMSKATLTTCTSRKKRDGPRFCGNHSMAPTNNQD